MKRHTYSLRSGRRQIKRWPRELDPIIDQLLKVQKLRAREFAGIDPLPTAHDEEIPAEVKADSRS
jgi:hypothetical protein